MVEQINRRRVPNLLDAFCSDDLKGAPAHLSDDIDYMAAPIDILPHPPAPASNFRQPR